MVGGSCGDDDSAMVASWGIVCSAVVASSDGIACSARVASSDGAVGSDGPSISCSGGGGIPKCYRIWLRMAVCWVCMAISWS